MEWCIIQSFSLSIARNAVCVIITAALAYGLMEDEYDKVFTITGNVTEGLPKFQAPDFGADDIFMVKFPWHNFE